MQIMSTDELSRQGLGLEHSLGISLAVPRFAPLDDVDVERTDLRALCLVSLQVAVCSAAVSVCLRGGLLCAWCCGGYEK